MPWLDRFINRYFFSIPSVIFHSAWFIAWFALHLNVGLLTNIVSLEAIYLSQFIGIAAKTRHDVTRDHISNLLGAS